MIDLTTLSAQLSVPVKVLADSGVVVITLNRYDNVLIQLVVIPKGTYIPSHNHPDIDNIVTPIHGEAKVMRDGEFKFIEGSNYNRSHSVKAGVEHSVETFDKPFAFISKQIWLHGTVPTSIEDNWND